MPMPKRKTSRANKRMRRAHDALKASAFSKCPNCGKTKQPHMVCPHCGMYKQKRIVVVE